MATRPSVWTFKSIPAGGPIGRPAYGDEWILRGLRKHEANYSSVICFETGDPKRLLQLKEFFCGSKAKEKGYGEHSVYVYDPWNGLGELDKATKQVNPERPGEGRRLEEETGEQIRDLGGCLNRMDPKLKGGKAILVLYWLTQEQEGKTHPRLVSALKAWATSEALIQWRSLVLLLAPHSSDILDEPTRDLVASIEVDTGHESEREAERKELVRYLAGVYGINLTEGEEDAVQKAIRGLNLHQAEALLRESYVLKHRFDLEQIKESKSELVKKTGVLEVEEPKGGFEEIGGYIAVKEFITKKIIEVIHKPERARKFALAEPRGILFFGPPGTGKTLFAKSLARAIEYPFINFKTENLYGQWLGESGRRMKSAIRTAEQMSPAIIFIDEIDRFGKRTATTDSAGEETRRVFSQMLEWLGDPDRKAIIVGATNRLQDLDEAFIRTGRFDYKIPLLYPDGEARLEILRIHLGLPGPDGKPSPKPKPPLALSDEDFLTFLRGEIVPYVQNYAGADLEELVNRSKRCAFEREAEAVDPDDFRKSLRSFRIDPESRRKQREDYATLARKYADDENFLRGLGIT